jgi:hypothetical protein
MPLEVQRGLASADTCAQDILFAGITAKVAAIISATCGGARVYQNPSKKMVQVFPALQNTGLSR